MYFDTKKNIFVFMSEITNKHNNFIIGYSMPASEDRCVVAYFCHPEDAMSHAYAPRERYFYDHIQITAEDQTLEPIKKYLKRKGIKIDYSEGFMQIPLADKLDGTTIKRIIHLWFKEAKLKDSIIYYSVGREQEDELELDDELDEEDYY